MISAFLSLGFALVIFALVAEAQSLWLQITGAVVAVLLTLAGAMAGWQSTKK